MKLHFKAFLLLPFFYLAVGCTNNSTKQTAQQDSDSVANKPTTQASIPHGLNSNQQFKEDVIKADEKETGLIANIRDEYQRIQRLENGGSLRKEMINFNCKNDPGSGQLVRYYEGDKMVLIDYLLNSEHWGEKKRIYLKNEEAFFVFKQEMSWMFGGPPSKTEYQNTIDKIKERRYYLNAGELIRQLNKEFEVKSWEQKVKSDNIPHTTVKLKPNSAYPDAATIPQMKKGIVGC
ncbi:hypothetical protein [Pedobacter cryophilus]|uniref:Lipoprotein n=1 Tax=Pedobacter cryophilus TaxID=2571271 RepID=A0A4U1C3T8_9SPHI|nr:hypothetical protein [Pedobacter cryophilus]TKB98779.1 hypothetical protein FA046_06585 [Pedobacter cryophilus]